MKRIPLVRQPGNRNLVLYVLGWASSPNAVYHIPLPPGFDSLVLRDYRTMEELKPEEFACYDRIYLIAWSYGVWVAEQIAAALPLHRAIAFNGTPFPTDEQYGMEVQLVLDTMSNPTEVSILDFIDMAYGGIEYVPLEPFPDWPLEEKVDELNTLLAASRTRSAAHLHWDAAYLGTKDVIFRPEKMRAYWGRVGLGTALDCYHYPFGDPDVVLRHLSD